MKILLDENMLPRLRRHFPNCDVRSARFDAAGKSRHERLNMEIFLVMLDSDIGAD